jgi:hypothetical protein
MIQTITRADQLKPKPAESNLGFDIHFTDNMLSMNYENLLQYAEQ